MTFAEFAAGFNSWVWAAPLFFLLLGCGLIFSVVTKFVQYRVFTHGLSCIRGDYDDPNDPGHISHFQALSAALSATIGLGNIAGVAVAISIGGPGAVFWMWVVGLFGMALKFMECTLAVMYRDVRDVPDPSAPALMEADAENRTLEYQGEPPPKRGAVPRARGEVRGGPMWYIQKAIVEPLRERGNGLWVVFKVLAVCFAIAAMLNSFGGGNMFQGWNVANTLRANFNVNTYVSATIVSFLVALVIIGGIRRIGQVASKLVPFMCVAYVLGALYLMVLHAPEIPHYLALIVKSAFSATAERGAFVGVGVWAAFEWGLRRACFSNEAGEGSAAMAHAAARTEEPIREGVVAGIGPFVDTIIICTMSALVMLSTGVWNRPPVGTVSEITDRAVVVACNPDLPAQFADTYRHEIEDKRELSIHLHRLVNEEPDTLVLNVSDIKSNGAAGWSGLERITLSTSGATPDHDHPLVVGQPVHLNLDGADLTRFAFDTGFPGLGKVVITIGVLLFAFSTMISWSYYGEKGAEYLLGPRAILPYKFLFVIFVFTGMVIEKFQAVYDFSDATTGLMVLCNLPAVLILSPAVLRAARNYFARLDSGQMPKVGK